MEITSTSGERVSKTFYVAHPWIKRERSYDCKIELGKQSIKIEQKKPAPKTEIVPTMDEFCGKCFMCGINGHSKNYCPLRRCEACGALGHGERACSMGYSKTRGSSYESFTVPCKKFHISSFHTKKNNTVERFDRWNRIYV